MKRATGPKINKFVGLYLNESLLLDLDRQRVKRVPPLSRSVYIRALVERDVKKAGGK